MTVISSLTNAAALTGAEFLPTSIAGQPAKRATVSAVAALAQPAIMLRSAFSTTTTNRSNYIMSGYSSVGDYGAGALYSSTGATSSGPMAISDAVGVVFNLATNDSTFVNAKYFNAKGDTSTDDTAALQAAINYSFQTGRSLHIPAGIYKTTSELTVSTTLNQGIGYRNGYQIFGDGNPYVAVATGSGAAAVAPDFGGTTIYYQGASGARGILTVFNGAYEFFSVRDLGLRVDRDTSGGTIPPATVSSNICVNGTINGNYIFSNLSLIGGAHAIRITTAADGGQNGESYYFENVFGYAVDVYYSNDDAQGQTYNHGFVNCGALIYQGGAYFLHNGSGLLIFNFSATGQSTFTVTGSGNRCSNTTLFRENPSINSVSGGLTLNNSPIAFYGGRVEHLTQIWQRTGGVAFNDYQVRLQVVIDNLQITADNYPTSGSTTVSVGSMFYMGGTDLISVRSCNFDFQATTGGSGLTVTDATGSNGFNWLVDFERCNFNRAGSKPDGWATTFPSKVKFRDCQYTNDAWPGQGNSDFVEIFTAQLPYETIWNFKDATTNSASQFDYIGAPRTAAVTGASALNGMKSNSAVPYQTKVYFEFSVVTGASGSVVMGVVDGSYSFAAGLGTTGGVGVAYNNNGSVVCNSVALLAANSVTAIAAGQIGGMAVDFVNMTVYVRNVTNVGNWNNSSTANPALSAGGKDISAVGTTNPMKMACQLMTNAASITMIPQGSSLTPGGGYNNWNSIAYVPIGTP